MAGMIQASMMRERGITLLGARTNRASGATVVGRGPGAWVAEHGGNFEGHLEASFSTGVPTSGSRPHRRDPFA